MRMLRPVLLSGVAALLAATSGACSSDDAAGDTRGGEIHGADVWKDGLVVTGALTIAKDGNVEIAPGAKITVAEGALIRIEGTLRARASASHATLRAQRWQGIIVAAGAKMDLEGVDLENTARAIGTAPDAQESRFAEGAILNSMQPFVISKGSKLALTNVKITTPSKGAQADVEGSLVAKRLDYDAYASEGVSVRPGGELDLEDSVIRGENGADLISAYGAKRVRLAYSTFKGSHCGIHIEPSESFEIDHVTSESVYGITIYGSGAGPNIVRSSNIIGGAAWLDFAGQNGAITFENVFTTGSEILKGGPIPPTISKATAPIADAKPR